MTTREQLEEALRDRYRIERELGRGGDPQWRSTIMIKEVAGLGSRR